MLKRHRLKRWIVRTATFLVLIIATVLLSSSSVTIPRAHALGLIEVEPGDSIQTAINSASPGDSIEVYSGTYVEQLNIAKPLTIYAPPGSTVTIRSPLLSFQKAPITIPGTSNLWDPVVQIHDTNGATLMGFTIDGNSQGNPSTTFAGVLVYQAVNVQVVANNIRNIFPVGGFSSSSVGVGIAVYQGLSEAYALLSANRITDYNNIGIIIDGNDASALVYQNTMYGVGSTSVTVQNGVEFTNGAAGGIYFNTISFQGSFVGPGPGVSAGILILNDKGFQKGQLSQYNIFVSDQVNILIV